MHFRPKNGMASIDETYSLTEAEIISLDAGLRMYGIPALDLWDLEIEVSYSVLSRTDGPKRSPGRKTRRQLSSQNMHNPIQNQAHQRHSNKH